jgi:hypothetical protein
MLESSGVATGKQLLGYKVEDKLHLGYANKNGRTPLV